MREDIQDNDLLICIEQILHECLHRDSELELEEEQRLKAEGEGGDELRPIHAADFGRYTEMSEGRQHEHVIENVEDYFYKKKIEVEAQSISGTASHHSPHSASSSPASILVRIPPKKQKKQKIDAVSTYEWLDGINYCISELIHHLQPKNEMFLWRQCFHLNDSNFCLNSTSNFKWRIQSLFRMPAEN